MSSIGFSEMKVNKRGGFSDRNNIKPLNKDIQTLSLDSHSRAAIANAVHGAYETIFGDTFYRNDNIQDFFRFVYSEIYSVVVPQGEDIYNVNFWKCIDSTILNDDYDDVLTLIEGIAQYLNSTREAKFYYEIRRGKRINSVFSLFNCLFEIEYVGYRFIGDKLSIISDEKEFVEVSEAINTPFAAINEHIEKANLLLSDRKNPDYANSIKESISAVEALCKIVTKEQGSSATLGKMIKKLDEYGVNIQPALSQAFDKLYGYTSNAKGVRHAGDIGGADTTFEEARFMLVACSAFINYVKGNLAKINPAVWRP